MRLHDLYCILKFKGAGGSAEILGDTLGDTLDDDDILTEAEGLWLDELLALSDADTDGLSDKDSEGLTDGEKLELMLGDSD